MSLELLPLAIKFDVLPLCTASNVLPDISSEPTRPATFASRRFNRPPPATFRTLSHRSPWPPRTHSDRLQRTSSP